MSTTTPVVHRFPDRELEIHRLCTRDPEFQAICQDYGQALAVHAHWRAKGPAGAARAVEYQAILAELEAEILDHLDKAGCRR